MADNDTDNNILQPGPNQFAAFCDESDAEDHNQDESCVTSRVIFPDGCHIPQKVSQGASAPKKATSLHLSGNRFAAFCDEQETDDFKFEDDLSWYHSVGPSLKGTCYIKKYGGAVSNLASSLPLLPITVMIRI